MEATIRIEVVADLDFHSHLRTDTMKAIFAYLLLFLAISTQADDLNNNQANVVFDNNTLIARCSTSANYTKGSQYEANLKLALSSLVSNGPQTGYYNTTLGEDLEKVYGLAQCRGDMPMETCRSCLHNRSVEILETCSISKSALLRYEYCLLRYSNEDFISKVNTSEPQKFYNPENVTNVDLLNQQLQTLMKNLSNQAAQLPSKFKTGDINYTEGYSKRVYGLVQCTRDLTSSSCSTCLQTIISLIPVLINGAKGGRISCASCFIRYELDPIEILYSLTAPTPSFTTLPPSATALPRSIAAPSLLNEKNYRNIVFIIIPIVVGVVLLFAEF